MIVAAFIGQAPDLDHPFAVGTSHTNAQMSLMNDAENLSVRMDPLLFTVSGYVAFKDNKYVYVDRKEAFIIAKCHRQLRDESETNEWLYSYQLKKLDYTHLHKLYDMSYESIKKGGEARK